jgi:hypothetical protein
MKALIEIPAHGQTIAVKSSILRELIKQLNISNDKFEEVTLNPPSAEEQKKAALNLGLEMNQIIQVLQEEAKVNSTEIETITFVNQTSRELSVNEIIRAANSKSELPVNPTNKNDESNSCFTEESQEDRERHLATQSQVQQFVIPVIVDRIHTYGKADKDKQSIVYKSEEYTASLTLEKDLQTINLDRNSPDSEEIQEVLLASKDINSDEYSITINNLTKDEFERFKVLFQEMQVRRQQNQEQIQNKDSDNEIS